MVFKIIWTPKAINSYISTINYLELAWTEKEVKKFILLVEKKLNVLKKQPNIGLSKNKSHNNIRYTIVHKRVSLIYRTKPKKNEIELLLFWNTYQNPSKLKAK
jgi:plasmid stabilization system protein ParE